MTKDYSNIIKALITRAGDTKADFSDDDIDAATRSIKQHIDTSDSDQIFLRLASINVLDSACDNPFFKKKITRQYVKNEASFLLRLLVLNNASQDVVRYYYNKEQDQIYFSVYGITFVFHNLKKSDITEKAAANQPIEWPGYKAKTIALDIYDLAKPKK